MTSSYVYASSLALLLHLAHGRTYIGVNMSVNWSDAENYCSTVYGTKLATITSVDENADVRTAATEAGISTSLRVWIGFNDIDSEGTWVWNDGTSATFANWSPGNPNDAGCGQDCASMYPLTGVQSIYNTTWDDNYCYNTYGFVCNEGKYVY